MCMSTKTIMPMDNIFIFMENKFISTPRAQRLQPKRVQRPSPGLAVEAPKQDVLTQKQSPKGFQPKRAQRPSPTLAVEAPRCRSHQTGGVNNKKNAKGEARRASPIVRQWSQ